MRTWILLALLFALSTVLASAQFKTVATAPATDADTADNDTLYAGTFTGNLGFMAFSGWNVGELYQGSVNVRRGFDDNSYINLFFTTPPPTEAQIFGVAYGSLLSNPTPDIWLFLNLGVHYSTYPYVGLAAGIEAKYDFTQTVGLSARADAVPAWNFHDVGLGFAGQIAITLTP